MSFTKYLRQELVSRKKVECPLLLRLDSLTSLQECHQHSRQAFDNLAAVDVNTTLHDHKENFPQKQFSKEEIHSHLPNGESYGLQSPCQHLISNGYQTQVAIFSFPHLVVQEFWAVFHTAISMQIDIFNYNTRIRINKFCLYFSCAKVTKDEVALANGHTYWWRIRKDAWRRIPSDYRTHGCCCSWNYCQWDA